jgi:hypothetical protein
MKWYRIENKQLTQLNNIEITNMSFDHDIFNESNISVAWAKLVADEGVYYFSPKSSIKCEGPVNIDQLYLVLNSLIAYLVCTTDDGYTIFYRS